MRGTLVYDQSIMLSFCCSRRPEAAAERPRRLGGADGRRQHGIGPLGSAEPLRWRQRRGARTLMKCDGGSVLGSGLAALLWRVCGFGWRLRLGGAKLRGRRQRRGPRALSYGVIYCGIKAVGALAAVAAAVFGAAQHWTQHKRSVLSGAKPRRRRQRRGLGAQKVSVPASRETGKAGSGGAVLLCGA